MKKSELIDLALKNAESHLPDVKLTDEIEIELSSLISVFEMVSDDVPRKWRCKEIQLLTKSILIRNSYTGRQRTFCASGLNCSCDIPCG